MHKESRKIFVLYASSGLWVHLKPSFEYHVEYIFKSTNLTGQTEKTSSLLQLLKYYCYYDIQEDVHYDYVKRDPVNTHPSAFNFLSVVHEISPVSTRGTNHKYRNRRTKCRKVGLVIQSFSMVALYSLE